MRTTGRRCWYKRAFVEYYSSPRGWLSNLRALRWNGGVRRYLRGLNALRALISHNPGRGLLPARTEPTKVEVS